MTAERPVASLGAVLTWMTLVLLWSALLAAGFAYSAISGADELSRTRTLVYALLSGFMGLLALRTGYEMYLRIRRSRHDPKS